VKRQENAEKARRVVSADNERRETLVKVTATLVTFLVLGLLTCALIAWLVWQMPGVDYNQGIYYNI